MAVKIESENELLLRGVKYFENEFGVPPEKAACAPGRVNLIGEHTDYNDGFVLPMALPLLTTVIGRKNNLNRCRIRTSAEGVDKPTFTEFIIPSERPVKANVPKWANYIKGVVSLFPETLVPGFDAVIVSSIPIGGGLASSAALEVSTYTFLENLTGKFTNNNRTKALICKKAENDYAGVPCGVMDQYISIVGGTNLIDCRTLEFTGLPDFINTFEIALINTNVKLELAREEYALRRSQCRKTADILRKRSLRDITIDELNDALKKGKLDEVIFRRSRHVILENERTKEASDCLLSGDMITFGKLMFCSHTSLSDDFEVSCAELDQLVEISKGVNGVVGSRMTGGGFGGSIVTLVDKSATNNLIEEVKANYRGIPSFYIVSACPGTKVMVLHKLKDGLTNL